jgi:hypothetical protein
MIHDDAFFRGGQMTAYASGDLASERINTPLLARAYRKAIDGRGPLLGKMGG